MSRSYKHTPSCHHVKKDTWWKKHFNHVIRHVDDIPSGNAYRRINEPWLIADWHEVSTTYREVEEWLTVDEYERLYLRK